MRTRSGGAAHELHRQGHTAGGGGLPPPSRAIRILRHAAPDDAGTAGRYDRKVDSTVNEHNNDQSQHAGPHFGLILALTVNGLAISEYPEMVRMSSIAAGYGFGSVCLCAPCLTLSPDAYVKHAGISGEDGQRRGRTRPASMPLLEAWTVLCTLTPAT